jgi:hypothetical protein
MLKKAIVMLIIGVAFLFGALFALALVVGKSTDIEGVSREAIDTRADFFVEDMCLVGERVFLIAWNRAGIYELRAGTVDHFMGEHGIGEGKFRGPRRLKDYQGVLFVLDVPNRQVVAVDTNGRHVGSFPKRESADFLFRRGGEDEFTIADFCISEKAFLVAGGRAENERVYIIDRPSGLVSTLEPTFSLITALAFSERDSTIYVVDGDRHTVYLLSFDGQLLRSVGKEGAIVFGFQTIEDLALAEDGTVYILDVMLTGAQERLGKGAIHAFSSRLDHKTSRFARQDRTVLHMPKALCVSKEDEALLVIDRDATELYRVEVQDQLSASPGH